jgi:hypothetical protein
MWLLIAERRAVRECVRQVMKCGRQSYRMTDVRLFVASGRLTTDDVRALKAFLESDEVGNEKALQALFQAHPLLMVVLGFSEFIAEYPLIKIDSRGQVFSGRKPDRADFVAAKPSALMPGPYINASDRVKEG